MYQVDCTHSGSANRVHAAIKEGSSADARGYSQGHINIKSTYKSAKADEREEPA